MLIENTTKFALPIPRNHNLLTGKPLSYEEMEERANLELRESLKHSAGESSGHKPLNAEERKKLRAYKAAKWTSNPPTWDGMQFPFAPKGQAGSIYDLTPAVARFLVEAYNAGSKYVCDMPNQPILRVLEDDEEPAVTPIRLSLDNPLTFTSDAYIEYDKPGGRIIRASKGLAEPPPPRPGAGSLGPSAKSVTVPAQS